MSKSRMITLGLAALAAASFLLSQMDAAFLAEFHLNALSFLTPKNCQRCAHTLVSVALILEAAALWVSARKEGHGATFNIVAMMFAGAGVLGLLSLGLELIPELVMTA